MNKLTKGAIATAAGVILLMGGAGTLASWNSSATSGASQAITAGSLSVTAAGAGTWKSGATTINPSTFKIVPGDSLVYTQTFNVAATGDNLLFTVASTPGTFGTTAAGADTNLAAQLNKSATFVVNGNSIAASTTAGTYKVASGSTASTIVVTMTISFPYGSAVDNSAQLGSVTLGTGAVTLTQTQTP